MPRILTETPGCFTPQHSPLHKYCPAPEMSWPPPSCVQASSKYAGGTRKSAGAPSTTNRRTAASHPRSSWHPLACEGVARGGGGGRPLDHRIVRLILSLLTPLQAIGELSSAGVSLALLVSVVRVVASPGGGHPDEEQADGQADLLLHGRRVRQEQHELFASLRVPVALVVVVPFFDGEGLLLQDVPLGVIEHGAGQAAGRTVVVGRAVVAVGLIVAERRSDARPRRLADVSGLDDAVLGHEVRQQVVVEVGDRGRWGFDHGLRVGGDDQDGGLLVAIGVVVVAAGNVGHELRRVGGALHEASVEVRVHRGVELGAVARVRLAVVLVLDVVQLLLREARAPAAQLAIQRVRVLPEVVQADHRLVAAVQLQRRLGALLRARRVLEELRAMRVVHGLDVLALARRILDVAGELGDHVGGLELDGHEIHPVRARVVVVVARNEVVGVRRASLSVVAAAARVVVGAGPLEVDVLAILAHHLVGHEVVLDGGIRLHDVAALAAPVEVDDHLGAHVLGHARHVGLGVGTGAIAGPRHDGEGVAAVLEGARVLVGVQRQRQEARRPRVGGAILVGGDVAAGGADVHVRVLHQRRVLLVVLQRVIGRVDHLAEAGVVGVAGAGPRRPVGHVGVGVVVADAQHDALEAAGDAFVVQRLLAHARLQEVRIGDGRQAPVEAVGVGRLHARLLEQRRGEEPVAVEGIVLVGADGVAQVVGPGEGRLAADDAGQLPAEGRVAERRFLPGEDRAVAFQLFALLAGARPLAVVPRAVVELVVHVRDGVAPALRGVVGAVARVPAAHRALAADLADARLRHRVVDLRRRERATLIVVATGDAVLLLAALGVVGQHGDVDPGTGRPVGVVVALLGALQAAAVAVGVLAGSAAVVAADALVGRPETAVAPSALAHFVVAVGLVHAVAPRGRRVGHGRLEVVGNGVGSGVVVVGGNAISRRGDVPTGAELLGGVVVRLAGDVGVHVAALGVSGALVHVLQHDVALGLGVAAAAVLVGPLDEQVGAFVVVHLLLLLVHQVAWTPHNAGKAS
eukprot:scaffold1016_cov258-Pinguiococcus_pyrenoidosus.AAC.12